MVSIIDDGLDSTNPDLVDNFYLEGSWDFNDPAQAPSPQPQSVEDSHGTRCAGEVAAGKNTACGLGVAYEAKVSGVRILSGPLTNADEAAATNYEYQKNQIYSCSWGPPDDGASVDRPTSLSQKSYIEAVTNGRGGKGSIYVFAAGNGGENYDQCNYDGFINQIYTIGIGAIDWKDAHPSYSESCTALNAVTYSSSTSYGPAIYTSDAMPNQCTSSHTGTSAAAPLAAGIFALVLQANPDITWRDAQQLIYDTAIVVNPADPSWESMASGRKFSSKFGFGRLDAYAMVEAAKKFVSLPPQTSLPYVGKTVNKGIPHGNTGISDTITITQAMVTAANLASMEHLQVFLTVTHPSRGQMKYEIVSPSGIRSLLGDTRPYDTSSQGLTNWTFMSLKHWGESPVGDWTFTIKDPVDASRVGNIVSWGVKIWGAQPGGAQPATSFRPSASGITKKTATTSTKATATATGTVDNSVEQTSTASQASQTINLTTPIFVTTTSTSSRPNSAPRTGRARMMALVAGFLGAALAVAI